MTSRKIPGVAFWATVVVLVALVAYPLSFGPVCWLTKRDPMTFNRKAPRLYWPGGWACVSGPRYIRRAFSWYAMLYGEQRYVLVVPADPSGALVVGM